jgi:hypothetical protein
VLWKKNISQPLFGLNFPYFFISIAGVWQSHPVITRVISDDNDVRQRRWWQRLP